MYKDPKLVYAINEKNELKHIDDVPNGNQCGCHCPGCGAALIARNLGKKQQHHFAHQSGENCQTGYETSLHLLAKDILSKAKAITLPEVSVCLNNHALLISKAREIEIEEVRLEERFVSGSDVIIPDVIIKDKKSGKTIFLEICVTHPIDNLKLKKIEQINISTIEIDLSNVIITIDNEINMSLVQLLAKDKELFECELKKHILYENNYKYWVYNGIITKWINRLREEAKDFITETFYLHSKVIGCPLHKNYYKGRPYADVLEDCFYDCKYCVDCWQNDYDEQTNSGGDEHVLCLGHIRRYLDSPQKFEQGDFREFEKYYNRKHKQNLNNMQI